MNVGEGGVTQVSTKIMDDLLLELQVWSYDLQDGEDIGVERTSKRWRSQNGGRRLRIGNVFGTERGPGMAGSGGCSRLDSESCEFLKKVLGSLDMCHHPDESQILTTTDMYVRVGVNYLIIYQNLNPNFWVCILFKRNIGFRSLKLYFQTWIQIWQTIKFKSFGRF